MFYFRQSNIHIFSSCSQAGKKGLAKYVVELNFPVNREFVRSFLSSPFLCLFFILYLFRERKKESNRNYAGSREGGGLSVKYLGCRARWHKFRTRCKIVLVKLACPQKESRRKLKSSGSIRFREEGEGLHTYGIFMMFTLYVSLSA